MSSLPRRKLSTRQPGTATPLSYNNLPTQWALSSNERAGGAGWWCRGGWMVGAGGENRTGGWQCCSELVSFCFCSRAGGHRWGTEQRPVCLTLWMQIMLHCTRLPQSSEGAGHLFCGYYECWGLFSGRAEHGCFPLFLHTGAERCAFILVIWKPWKTIYSSG